MSDPAIKVVVTRKLPEPVEKRLSELFDVELNETDTPMTRDELMAAMKRADILVPTVTDTIDAGMLAGAEGKLQMIANYGGGVDHIDVRTATTRGIRVTNTPGVTADDTANMTMGMIIAVPRRLKEGALAMMDGSWGGYSPTGLLGHRIGGKRLGIIGMGYVGQAVARRAATFDMQVHYFDRARLHPETEADVGAHFWEDLDEMLPRMDIVAITVASTTDTFHLLDSRRLKLLKKDAYLINTSRGEIIDEKALIRLLKADEIGGAGLDVFESEEDVRRELAQMPNVLLLPHMSSATHESRLEMGEKVIINIKTHVDGHRPPDQVVTAML